MREPRFVTAANLVALERILPFRRNDNVRHSVRPEILSRHRQSRAVVNVSCVYMQRMERVNQVRLRRRKSNGYISSISRI